MKAKGTLIVYPDVHWATPKSFKDLENAGFIYKFYDFVVDYNDSIAPIINQVCADSKSFKYWAALFIPSTR